MGNDISGQVQVDPSAKTHQVSSLWRALAYGCLLVLALGTAASASMYAQFVEQIQFYQRQLQGAGYTKYIAVLLDDSQQPALLVTRDSLDGAIQLQRLNSVREGREDTMQLWALPAGDGSPVSLGILQSSAPTLRLPVADSSLAQVSRLAISVENKGGAAQGKPPRLPYLFSGALVQKAH